MKQFSIYEHLKNPSRKIITRDGRPARIICTDAQCSYPVVALVKDRGTETTYNFTSDGNHFRDESCCLDLFFEPTVCKGWVNVYMASDGTHKRTGTSIYDTKEEAMENCTVCGDYVNTVPIEWEA